MKHQLLTRDQFRAQVFARDKHTCVWCGAPAADAHHIIERRLFSDGGYYLANGASVCGACHLKAESTEISCDDLRQKIGIKSFPLPEHLYRDQQYDKWGNPILPSGQRLIGELYHDASVQKVLAPVLHLFSKYVKYPRTWHLSWSPGKTDDDRVLTDTGAFHGKRVVQTLKMDGENTTFYNDYMHARSLTYESHPSRSRVRAIHARVAANIPPGWRVCGENLFAKHSISYKNLEDYFLVFSVWNDRNICLSWDETIEWAALLELKTMPVLHDGSWESMPELPPKTHDGNEVEGFVVRVAESFRYEQFRTHVAKYVRANHVQTHGHWIRSVLEQNELKR